MTKVLKIILQPRTVYIILLCGTIEGIGYTEMCTKIDHRSKNCTEIGCTKMDMYKKWICTEMELHQTTVLCHIL